MAFECVEDQIALLSTGSNSIPEYHHTKFFQPPYSKEVPKIPQDLLFLLVNCFLTFL